MSNDHYLAGGGSSYFDEEGESGTSGGTLVVAAVAGAIGLVVGSFVWNVYSEGLRSQTGELPIIGANLDNYRLAPINADQDGIRQSDLRFLDPELQAKDKEALEVIQTHDVGSDTLQASLTNRNNVGGPPISISQTPSSPPEYQANPSAITIPIPAEPAQINESQVEAPTETNVTVSIPPPIAYANLPRSYTDFVFNGPYLVQLAALRTEEDANRLWDEKLSASPALFSGAKKHIQRADLDANGIWYRLKVDGFGSRADAKAYCSDLKAAGIDCLVTQR